MYIDEVFELEIEDAIAEIYTDFMPEQITMFLLRIGLLSNWVGCRVETFERLVFLQGNPEEIYSQEEIRFIESVGRVYVYPDFFMKAENMDMVCRIVAVDLSSSRNFISQGVMFMKLVNKSLQGFTVFLLKLFDGIHIGCRIFDKIEWKDCVMSEIEMLEQIAYDISWVGEQKDFLSYYNLIKEAIMLSGFHELDYDERMRRKRGIGDEYMAGMQCSEKCTETSICREEVYYVDGLDSVLKNSFKLELEWCMEDFSYIKSVKINTMEMLFEAEAIENVIDETYQRTQRILKINEHEVDLDEKICVVEQYMNDPETIIKVLRRQQEVVGGRTNEGL